MSSKATKGLSLPTSPPWGFPPPCQELWALLNSRTLYNIQKMYSEPLQPLTSHSGELKGLTGLCRLRPCWTKAGKAAHSQAAQGGTGVFGWRPFTGSCFGSSVLPEAPGAGHLDCAARGLRRPNARGPGTASSIEGKPAWCEDHVLLIWPCTTLVCSFFFLGRRAFLCGDMEPPPHPLLQTSPPSSPTPVGSVG